jgi:hypothetical protein
MEKDLEQRTKRFGLAVIRFCSSLPRTREAGCSRQATFAFGNVDRRKLSGSESRRLARGFCEQNWYGPKRSLRNSVLARIADRVGNCQETRRNASQGSDRIAGDFHVDREKAERMIPEVFLL